VMQPYWRIPQQQGKTIAGERTSTRSTKRPSFTPQYLHTINLIAPRGSIFRCAGDPGTVAINLPPRWTSTSPRPWEKWLVRQKEFALWPRVSADYEIGDTCCVFSRTPTSLLHRNSSPILAMAASPYSNLTHPLAGVHLFTLPEPPSAGGSPSLGTILQELRSTSCPQCSLSASEPEALERHVTHYPKYGSAKHLMHYGFIKTLRGIVE
jgi:hypothetical protein